MSTYCTVIAHYSVHSLSARTSVLTGGMMVWYVCADVKKEKESSRRERKDRQEKT
jgi:hypothetical protein